MSQGLTVAEDQLRSALDRYVRACSSTRDVCLGGVQINDRPDLLAFLDSQSNRITCHIQQLKGAQAMVHSARNSIRKVAPITALPAEVLAHIFWLVIPGQSCLVHRSYTGRISQLKYPLYPDRLAHVCSFWRRVATGTPSLWTHIDIALDHSLNPALFARAKVYATRAGQLPLEIHISDPGSQRERKRESAIRVGGLKLGDPSHNPAYNWEDLHHFKIFASELATVPIKILEIDLRIYNRVRDVYFSVLEYFFSHCKPGVLTQYIVRNDSFGTHSNYFIAPAGTPHSGASILLKVPADHLEELWRCTPVVRVGAICPYWTSKAYHGLVELHIHPSAPFISEPELFSILRSSPKLQVLHFNVDIYDLTDDEDFGPVYLEDLQDLNLMVRGGANIATYRILQRIVPGSRPLQLSLSGFLERSVKDFFSRANVTRLYTWDAPSLKFLFDQCPRLEILALNGDELDLRSLIDRVVNPVAGNFNDPDRDKLVYKPVSASTRIDTLYLLWASEVALEEIRAVIEGYSVQRLFIYNAHLSYPTEQGRTVCKNTRNIEAMLSTITGCIIEYHPNDHLPGGNCGGDWMDPNAWVRASSSVFLQ
ncbi:putative F-box-like domain protein [Rhizoctonia solani 123E]|uniref:Putative F-box-like domain protein n=1 Tax=Rhizoctonia solani 123E TaxID=1423351 RepID=A0A074SK16_9AGAM|nr:putative F-box-like domain protein [Rhizoctonia solani 123E]